MPTQNRSLRAKIEKKPKAPMPAATYHNGRSMVHPARDLDEACDAIIFNKRRDRVRKLDAKREEDHRAKVAAVTLPKLKWMGQI